MNLELKKIYPPFTILNEISITESMLKSHKNNFEYVLKYKGQMQFNPSGKPISKIIRIKKY